MSIKFTDAELAQIRGLVHTHSKSSNANPCAAKHSDNTIDEVEFELEFRIGSFGMPHIDASCSSGFQPGVSENAFRRLMRAHTGHYPSFRTTTTAIREIDGNEFFDREKGTTKRKDVLQRLDLLEWNLRIAYAQEITRNVDESNEGRWNTLSSFHQREKDRTSFMMDRSIRLDLTHVTTTITTMQGTKKDHTYEVELEILAHRDHEMYTPQVLNQTILPALNSVFQILQDSRCPLAISQIRSIHNEFQTLTGCLISEYSDQTINTELLHRGNIAEIEQCLLYAKSNNAMRAYLLVAMDSIYMFTTQHGWRQIALPNPEVMSWNGTVLCGQFDGISFFAEEMRYLRGQQTDNVEIHQMKSLDATNTLERRITEIYQRKVFQVKEFKTTQSIAELHSAVDDMIERFQKRGPYTLDAMIFRTNKGLYVWNIQTTFFLRFSKALADPFLYSEAEKVAKCPVPNFCVVNLYPGCLGEFRIAKQFPNEERKMGQFELIRLCSDRTEVDTIAEVQAKIAYLHEPLTRKFFKTLKRLDKEPIKETIQQGFKPINNEQVNSKRLTPISKISPSPIHKPLPLLRLPTSNLSVSTATATTKTKIKGIIKRKRKSRAIKWKNCSGTSGFGPKATLLNPSAKDGLQ